MGHAHSIGTLTYGINPMQGECSTYHSEISLGLSGLYAYAYVCSIVTCRTNPRVYVGCITVRFTLGVSSMHTRM